MTLGRVLVIEDDPDLANILRLALPSLGAREVKVRNHGQRGLETALAESFDLVLVDLLLPGRDGFDVVRTLRRRLPADRSTILFLTSAASGLDRRFLERSGADGILEKPFSLSELRTALREATGRDRPRVAR